MVGLTFRLTFHHHVCRHHGGVQMTGACVMLQHDECSDSIKDECICSCPCHIDQAEKKVKLMLDMIQLEEK